MNQQTKRPLGDIPGLELHLHPNLVKWIGFVCLCFGSFSSAVIQQGILHLDVGDSAWEAISQNSALTAWANAAVICTAISYLAIPIYAKLVYEGALRSSNGRAYLIRLALLALAAEVPYDLVTAGTWLNWSSQNPTWGLALSALMMLLFRDNVQPGPRGSVIQCLIMAMALAWTMVLQIQFGMLTVLLVAIFAIFDRKKTVASLGGGLACFLQFPAPLGMFVAHWYDGDKGVPKKYLFYVLYLVQLVFFAVMAMVIS